MIRVVRGANIALRLIEHEVTWTVLLRQRVAIVSDIMFREQFERCITDDFAIDGDTIAADFTPGNNEIYNVIYALAAQGVAVLFASSDLPEVLGVADRIVVMREGEIAGELLHEQADERQALSLAMPKVSQAVA